MHPNAEAAIAGRLTYVLNTLRVSENGTTDIDDVAERGLREYESEVLKHCHEWLRGIDVLFMLINASYKYRNEVRGKAALPDTRLLADYLGRERIQRLHGELIDELKSLPTTYRGYLVLPMLSPEGFTTCELAPGVTLINGNELKGDSAFRRHTSPRHAVAEALLAEADKESTIDVTYLACTVSGYYREDAASSGAAALLAKIKQVLSLAEVTNMIVKPALADLMISTQDATHLVVRNESKQRYETAIGLPNLIRARAGRLKFSTTIFEPRTGLLLREKFVDKSARMQEAFRSAALCFKEPEQHADILTAAEWAFDAAAEDNHTLSYLYSAIGLEAILGAPEKELTSALGDRLAYLIGSSRTERREIQTKFKSFYEHRSKIVHGKKARLRAEEVDLMRWAQWCINRAIARELSLIKQ